MRSPRDLLLLVTTLVGLLGVGIVAFSFGGTPVQGAELPAPAPIEAPRPLEAPIEPGGAVAVDGGFRRSETTGAVAAPLQRTTGMIRGDITLAAAVVPTLETVIVRVVEAVQPTHGAPPPFTMQHVIRFAPSDGTPRFALDDIPFSSAGYVVHAFAAGLNGTEQVVQLNADHPVADVVLGIHPGTPFSLLLRDQDLGPIVDTDVTMMPVGSPLGRPTYAKRADTFGAVVFENVLRGQYQVLVGPLTQPLLEPVPVEVFATSGVQVQSKTIVVPRGESLTVNVFGLGGHGMAEIEVKVTSGSDTRFREFKQPTNWGGTATFEHLVPGTYWVNVLDPRYEPRTLPAHVKAGEKPNAVEVRLVPRR